MRPPGPEHMSSRPSQNHPASSPVIERTPLESRILSAATLSNAANRPDEPIMAGRKSARQGWSWVSSLILIAKLRKMPKRDSCFCHANQPRNAPYCRSPHFVTALPPVLRFGRHSRKGRRPAVLSLLAARPVADRSHAENLATGAKISLALPPTSVLSCASPSRPACGLRPGAGDRGEEHADP